MRKLEVGAGYSRLAPDWETSDIVAHPGIDHVCDATMIHTLGKFDRLFACHVLEHLGQLSHMLALKSWYMALTDEGLLEVIVPDMEYIAQLILRHPESGMHLAYGEFDDDVFMGHRWGFTRRTLEDKLVAVGFKAEVLYNEDNTLYARATK